MATRKVASVPLPPLPAGDDAMPANQRLDDRGYEEFRPACER
jgi:hypothetical protein